MIDLIKQQILAMANPEKAQKAVRFHKTGPGEYAFGDKFLGISIPDLRKAVKSWDKISLDDCVKLLKSEWHEIRLLALFILVKKFEGGSEQLQAQIYELYLENTQYINNWDLVDCSAHKIVGVFLLDQNDEILFELAKSKCLWQRRIAVISTFTFIRASKFDQILKISEMLLDDQEDLIHKAVGWMLREVGKRNPALLNNFLQRHYERLPRATLRYAIEKHSFQERKAILAGNFKHTITN